MIGREVGLLKVLCAVFFPTPIFLHNLWFLWAFLGVIVSPLFAFFSHFAKGRFMLSHMAGVMIMMKIDSLFLFTFVNVHLKTALEIISNFDVEK